MLWGWQFSFSCCCCCLLCFPARLNMNELSILLKMYLMCSGLLCGSMLETNISVVSVAIIIFFYFISKLTYTLTPAGSDLPNSLNQFSSLVYIFCVFVFTYFLFYVYEHSNIIYLSVLVHPIKVSFKGKEQIKSINLKPLIAMSGTWECTVNMSGWQIAEHWEA